MAEEVFCAPSLPMLIKLLTYSAIWIAFGFLAGSAIWLGMVIARRRAQVPMLRSEEPAPLPVDAAQATTTYRVLKGGMAGKQDAEEAHTRRAGGESKLLNFPR